ncbi:MAG: hypothetical protein M5R42_09525 [Rhodocyclaceae bacterium]|nr:hypothetical protein [Rhodocyclaceae bacterium]
MSSRGRTVLLAGQGQRTGNTVRFPTLIEAAEDMEYSDESDFEPGGDAGRSRRRARHLRLDRSRHGRTGRGRRAAHRDH